MTAALALAPEITDPATALAAGDVVKYNRDGLARLVELQADGRWTADFFAGAAKFIGKRRTIAATVAMRRELAPRAIEVVEPELDDEEPAADAHEDWDLAAAREIAASDAAAAVADEPATAPAPKAAPKGRKPRYLATLVAERAEVVANLGEWVKVGEGTTAYAADNHVYDVNKGRGGELWEAGEYEFRAQRRNTVEVWVKALTATEK